MKGLYCIHGTLNLIAFILWEPHTTNPKSVNNLCYERFWKSNFCGSEVKTGNICGTKCCSYGALFIVYSAFITIKSSLPSVFVDIPSLY